MTLAGRPRMVVLDGHTLNPGDLDWTPLDALGELTVHPRSAPDDIVPRAGTAEIVLTNKAVLDRSAIGRLPALRYIGVTATGVNVVDLAAARERGLVVTNVPAYGTASVAQHTIALLLELTQACGRHATLVREGRWSACPDFSFTDGPLQELAGHQFGVVGFGHIGRAVARLAAAFEMTVLAHTRTPPAHTAGEPVRFVDLETLFHEADIISLHCPLTEATRHLVNRERLARMKPGALLLNTARGPLLDEVAVAEALRAGRLGGAGLDVLSEEPPPPDHPLLSAPRCLITPHLAWATRAARQRLLDAVVANVRAFLDGRPTNVVNR